MFKKAKSVHPQVYVNAFDGDDPHKKPNYVTHQHPPLKDDNHIIIDIKKNQKYQSKSTQTDHIFPISKDEFLTVLEEHDQKKHQRHRDNFDMSETKKELEELRAEKNRGKWNTRMSHAKKLGLMGIGGVISVGANQLWNAFH